MLTVTTPPTGYPVSLDEMKQQLRVDDGADDPLIQSYIAAATQHVENAIGRALLTQGLTLTLNRFPACHARPIELVRGPVQVDAGVTISYTDSDGAAQTLADIQISPSFAGADVFPAVGESWPATQYGKADAVRVVYTAGYGAAADAPQPIRQAIMLLASDFYERRAETITGTIVGKLGAVNMLLDPFRIVGFG